MEVSSHKTGDFLVLRLAGRLDANWCGHVQEALATAVKDGEHRLHLDMSGVNYLSSAGIRVLITFYKQLRAIAGELGVVNPSAVVRSVLDLSGLGMLISSHATLAAYTVEPRAAESKSTARAAWKIFPTSTPTASMRVTVIGDAKVLASGTTTPSVGARTFGEKTFALGVGELGMADADRVSRAGEFLAMAGVAAFQPADGLSSRPDFMVTEGSLAPQGRLLLGICGEGEFAKLLRFEATDEGRMVGLTELAQTALEVIGAPALVMVGITETAGLVGATLRKSPATEVSANTSGSVSPTFAGLGARFAFPEIRDWLSFTSERAFRDSTSLFVGVAARRGTDLDPLLRPMGRGSELVGHFHAAVFPYRPLRKGHIELKPSVAELFEGQPPQAILHLLADSRGFNGAGESEFLRGALWIAPAIFPANGNPTS